MSDLQFYLNNSYSPARFMIKLDWYQDLPSGNSNFSFDTIGQKSLFLHEYIHFLQEISTAYGRMKTSCMLMGALQRSHQLRMSNFPDLKVPIEFDRKSCNEVLFFNESASPFYAGTAFIQRLREKPFKIKSLRPISHVIAGKELRYLNGNIEYSDGNTYEINVGGEILSESMAYLAEKNFMDVNYEPGRPVSPYPYLMVNKIAEKIYPEIAHNNLLLYKIVDLCLSKAYNPGIVFYDFLKLLKEKKFSDAADDSKLISLFEANPPHSHPLSLIADEVLLEMNQCFQSKYFDTTIQWIKELYSRADFLRLCDSLFMKEFFTPDGISSLGQSFIERLFGYPYIINYEHKGIWRAPHSFKFNLRQNIEFHLLAAAIEIGHTLKTYGSCRLRPFCEVSPEEAVRNMVDEICNHPCDKFTEITDSSPSKRLCPFAAMWKHWGLQGKSVSPS